MSLVTDTRTPDRNYPTPGAGNDLVTDRDRLIEALFAIDVDVQGLVQALTSKVDAQNPVFEGDVEFTTQAPGDGSNKAATTAYVDAAVQDIDTSGFAPSENPTFTGDPKAPTRTNGDVSKSIATTEFVDAATANAAPIGLMGHWPTTTPPIGWLKRNGAAISRTTYAKLFAVIGTAFGAGNGTTTFNLPDDRGNFDRGLDDGRGVDPGRTIGSFQDSQNRAHDHTVTINGAGSHSHTVGSRKRNYYGPGERMASVNSENATSSEEAPMTTSTAPNHIHTGSIGSSGGSEARPRNNAYLAIIRAY